MTESVMHTVVAVFATTEPPSYDADGVPFISGKVDFQGMVIGTPAENGGVFLSSYRDPDLPAEDLAGLLDAAAEEFRTVASSTPSA